MDRREAVAEDIRALADDLKSLLESATTDPKERQRMERRWNALQGAIGVLTTLVARRLAVKLWGILTGEEAPTAKPPGARPPARQERQAETISSSSSSVK
ncbi:MAG TPA: hypothetical protein VE736_06645 [Gaiellaceae bacterium]|jgi:hypothetical protein|nr:hypothetical protein [Gaiellaceae bacterium]